MEFSAPFTKAQLYSDRQPIDSKTTKGKALQAVLHLDPPAGKPVHVRCGISAVSAANALKNLRAEQSDWDFAATRAKAKASWQRELSRIRIDGATSDQQAIFYTSLYHMMCAPTLMDDVTGEYRGMDGQVHTLAAGRTQLLQLLALGHLPLSASGIHTLSARTRSIDGQLPRRHGRAESRGHAGVASAG